MMHLPDRTAALRQALPHLHAGRFAAAADLCRPLAGAGWDLEAWLVFGLALGGAGDVEGAAPVLARVARARPAHLHPVQDLLGLLRRHGRVEDGLAHLRAALRHAPDDSRLPPLLALDLLERRRPEEALAALDDIPAPSARGAVLAELGRMDEAVAQFREAARLAPGEAASWSNLGKALAAGGHFDEGLAALDRAVRLAPGDAQIAMNRAVALLKVGRCAEGWAAFECRHALPGQRSMPPTPRLPPLAHAGSLAGRTVLLVHEEGFGDTLQMIRYAPLLAERGARVLAWVPHALTRLVRAAPGVAGVLAPGDAMPRHDWHCPVLGLPGAFGTGPGTIPADVPYLRVEPGWAAEWGGKLGHRAAAVPRGDAGGAHQAAAARVGLVWAGASYAGSPESVDRLRSVFPALLAPLLAVPGVQWVSLQKDAGPGDGMLDPMPGVRDFADTAGIVAHLDAVVSVDTAVAHLAGALGKPVLLLDRFDGCWRWFHGREDSPWYPTLRIFRQDRPGDWAPAVRRAAEALREIALREINVSRPSAAPPRAASPG